MSSESMNSSQAKRPWHLWLIAILSFLWYLSGTYTILMAQAGNLPNLSVDEAAYYKTQPIWFVILTDISLFSALFLGNEKTLRFNMINNNHVED